MGKSFSLNQLTLVCNLKSNSEYHSIAFSSLVLYFQLVSITGYCDIKQVFIHPSILQKLYYTGFIPTEAKLISICHNESVKTYMYVKLYSIHPYTYTITILSVSQSNVIQLYLFCHMQGIDLHFFFKNFFLAN